MFSDWAKHVQAQCGTSQMWIRFLLTCGHLVVSMKWVCGCEPHAWQADVLSSESVSGFSDRSKCWWLNPECGCMAVICDVLTSWQKEIASTTCLDSSRTHSQKSGKGGRGTGCLVYFLCALLLFVWFCNLRKGLEVELSLFKIMVFFPVSVVLQ